MDQAGEGDNQPIFRPFDVPEESFAIAQQHARYAGLHSERSGFSDEILD